MIKYSDSPLDNLKKFTPLYYQLYNISVFITYFGLIIISWYFINLAYTINSQSYNILQKDWGNLTYYAKLLGLITWLYFLYFYVANEIRFRFIHFANKGDEQKAKQHNYYFVSASLFLTIFSILILFI